MAKILSFRSKEDTSAASSFVADETEKLSFLTAEDGAVSLDEIPGDPTPVAGVYADPRKDWSNQELADLFRVRQLLSGAGVPVETLRGVTDEGDPWFLFCHLNGDVFIHMARIDGWYVLDSPNVTRPLRGIDFNGLIADFTDDALPSRGATADGEESEQRVVRLERGGKVRLHPSAMLAALIWTLFLAAEELVMMLPEEPVEPSDDLLDFSNMISADAEITPVEDDAFEEANTQAAASFKIDHTETIQTAAPEGQMRDIMGQQGLAMQQNAYAMGLSTIAIAMGFMSEAVLHDNQRKVLEGLNALGLPQAETEEAEASELADGAGTSNDALMAKLAEFLGLDLSLNTDTAEAATPATQAALIDPAMLAEAVMTVDAALPVKATPAAARDTDDAEVTDAADALAQTTSSAADELILIAAAEQQGTVNMADLIKGTLQMEEFQLGQTTVMASFDLSDKDASSLSDFLFFGQRTLEHNAFDDRAQAFIDFIHAKDTDVGVITIGNEIIMIDRSAFLDVTADTYSYSWETQDGQVISMIGLRTEFEQFDLIA